MSGRPRLRGEIAAAAHDTVARLMVDIRQARAAAGRSVADVAASAHVSSATVLRIEGRTGPAPSILALSAVAHDLGHEIVLVPRGHRATARARAEHARALAARHADVRERLVDAVTEALSATDPATIDRALARVTAAADRWHTDITTTPESSHTP